MKIITANLNEQIPVYHQYPQQCNVQPAYIELDCRGEGELMADYSGEIGNAVPIYYWNNLAVRWSINAAASGDNLKELFASEEFLAICQRIVDGFEEEWDGINYVGQYSEDASDAIEEAENYIDKNLEYVEVWDVNNWLFNNCTLKEYWSDQLISEAAKSIESCVDSNQAITGDIEEALINEAAELAYSGRWDQLTETHIAELLKRGKISGSDADEWREDQEATG